jgi:hypothetical protein
MKAATLAFFSTLDRSVVNEPVCFTEVCHLRVAFREFQQSFVVEMS